jgi:7,8-dihydropterin-6-yl-methyl-4-(beta-D-ribofuranosyl)aminobenzene 5'-phosphate synthase
MDDSIVVGSVDQASITVVVDNKADLIVESNERVKYFTDQPLLAEHGFSALIQLGGTEKRILWDAGVSRVALIENLRRMKLDLASIYTIAMSHGHLDHYAALTDLLMEMTLLPQEKEWGTSLEWSEVEAWKSTFRIPIVAHPAAFRERWRQKKDGTLVGPFLRPPEQAWQALGAEIVLSKSSYQLGAGCWTTGYIPRNSFEKTGRPQELRYRDGSQLLPDDIDDDQAIVINVAGKGLIVLSGCAHSGIVNTIAYARQRFGVDTVYAVIGGFHLADANDEEIDQTIDYILALEPDLVVPCHCTGLKAISRFAQAMGDRFVEGVVGTTYLL